MSNIYSTHISKLKVNISKSFILLNVIWIFSFTFLPREYYNYFLIFSSAISIFSLGKILNHQLKKDNPLNIFSYTLAFSIPLSLIISIFNLNFSLIPFQILFLFYSAISVQNNKEFAYRLFFYAYLWSLFILVSKILLGFSSTEMFMFSKNMLILPFYPLTSLVLIWNFSKRRKLIYSFVFLLICIYSFSIGNIFLGFSFFLSVFLPDKKGLSAVVQNFKISKKLLISSLFLPISYGGAFFIIKKLSNNFIGISAIGSLLAGNFYTIVDLPRFQVIKYYISQLNLIKFMLGAQIENFPINTWGVDAAFYKNPHNTLIYMHNSNGIAGFLVFFCFLTGAFYYFTNVSMQGGIIFLSILLRSLSDTILVASGIGAFIIYLPFIIEIQKKNELVNSIKNLKR